MFTFKQFEKLNSLWDGKAINGDKICKSCGLCCNNTEKSLFPGELEYLQQKTGQSNSLWCSHNCLCYDLKDIVKPVICKIYPLRLIVDRNSWYVFKDNYSYYSDLCLDLEYDLENKDMKAYFDFLFSDIDNRLHFIINHCLSDEIIPYEKEELKKRGVKLSAHELYVHSLKKVLGLVPDFIYI